MRFGGTVVFKARDEYGLIEVVENRTLRKLHFDSPIEQSCQFRHAPMTLNFEYQQTMLAQLSDHYYQQPKSAGYRILMLGMGGGIMATHLHHTLPKVHITIVELRELVIEVAYRYFQLPQVPEIESVQADAIAFIAELAQACQTQKALGYDGILVDLFDAQGLPAELCAQAFHQQLAECVKPGGRLLYNLWNRLEANQQKTPTEETAQILTHLQALPRKVRQRQDLLMHSTSNLVVCLDF